LIPLPSSRDPRRLGADGETAAACWYESRGYEVVGRNWRVREGELDLVLRKDRTLVFCEVKTRTSARFGVPVEAVTVDKARRVRLLASRFLDSYPGSGWEIRFDVASVVPFGSVIRSDDVEVFEAVF